MVSIINYITILQMGKEQMVVKDQTKQQGKKIIKKFPFKNIKSKTSPQDQELNEWKPQKISQIKDKEKKLLQKEQSNIATNFLSLLPQPTSKSQPKPSFLNEKFMMRPKPKTIKIQPTQQQRKWDIQDQTFIQKQFVKEQKNIEHQLVEEDEGEITVDRIKWLNQNPSKTKEIDLTKVIDSNWKATVDKASFQTDIWSTKFLEGKGQLSGFVKDAINKFDQDEVTINRRAMIKQKIKSRYGW